MLRIMRYCCFSDEYPKLVGWITYFESSLFFGQVYTLMFGAYFEFILSGYLAFHRPPYD